MRDGLPSCRNGCESCCAYSASDAYAASIASSMQRSAFKLRG